MTFKRTSKRTPLTCGIEGQELVIRIGIGTLAYATAHQEEFESLGVTITDPRKFAEGVATAMQEEDDAGASHLEKFVDRAAFHAIAEGCLGVSSG